MYFCLRIVCLSVLSQLNKTFITIVVPSVMVDACRPVPSEGPEVVFLWKCTVKAAALAPVPRSRPNVKSVISAEISDVIDSTMRSVVSSFLPALFIVRRPRANKPNP
ncbi:hypothetical protein Pelo_19390 [Pelomyxa schiedti]|nr:hypothetical protein Pelo_19390 [Pelomyxa schiedti]